MGKHFEATVLVENTSVSELQSEHGLSIYVCYGSLRLLLDFGQTAAFALNADELGIDLSAADVAVLSHAHYDHADGMETFFERNDHASLLLSSSCAENCWSTKGGSIEPHYIGIKPGTLERFASRITPVSVRKTTTIAPGVHLVPHTTPELAQLGKRAGMLLRTKDAWQPDDFAHEMSLVFELENSTDGTQRLVVLNSCSHAGLPAITAEVGTAFPGARIAAFIGGLHLMRSSDEDIERVAEDIRSAGIEHIYTGHCTGNHAFELLSEALPGRMTALHPGLTIEL